MTLAELLDRHAAIVDAECDPDGLVVHDPDVARAFANVARAVDTCAELSWQGRGMTDAWDALLKARDELRAVLAKKMGQA